MVVFNVYHIITYYGSLEKVFIIQYKKNSAKFLFNWWGKQSHYMMKYLKFNTDKTINNITNVSGENFQTNIAIKPN